MYRKHTITPKPDPWELAGLLLRGLCGLAFILGALFIISSFFNTLKKLQPQHPDKTYLHNPSKGIVAKSN